MNTPICDFVEHYAAGEPVRFHMPGHKGRGSFGVERLDITEIPGADVLYSSNGIIRQSEENASNLFGSARTLYSTEGSSLCIRAMLYLATIHARFQGKTARIAAGRNAHRAFLEAAAVLDTEIIWIGSGEELLHAEISEEDLKKLFAEEQTAPTAVYLTSPDYLGHCTDLKPLSEICRRNGALLLVDNAHGAYRKFLAESRHPLDLGADFCCDSAHKTLPVLTGGAYLHASRNCPVVLTEMMERSMSLFASTSPSWLILQSLDAANALLDGNYPEHIRQAAARIEACRRRLKATGWTVTGEEELKLTLCPKTRGYTGTELSEYLRQRGLVSEFADPDYLVLMISPETKEKSIRQLMEVLLTHPKKTPIAERPPAPACRLPVLSPHDALFFPFENVPIEESIGRILASPSVSCPPAVPICICGERIDENALALFRYYGIESCDVIR